LQLTSKISLEFDFSSS